MLSTSNLVVARIVVEDASLVVVVAVAVMAAVSWDNLGSSSSSSMVVATCLGSNLDKLDTLVATLMAILVADPLGSSLDMVEVVVVVPGGVALAPEEVALQQGRSSVSGVERQVTSLPIARKLWLMWYKLMTTIKVKRRSYELINHFQVH